MMGPQRGSHCFHYSLHLLAGLQDEENVVVGWDTNLKEQLQVLQELVIVNSMNPSPCVILWRQAGGYALCNACGNVLNARQSETQSAPKESSCIITLPQSRAQLLQQVTKWL